MTFEEISSRFIMKMCLFLSMILICGMDCAVMLELCVPVIIINTEPKLTFTNSLDFRNLSKQRNVQITCTLKKNEFAESQNDYFINSHNNCLARNVIARQSPCVKNLLYDN